MTVPLTRRKIPPTVGEAAPRSLAVNIWKRLKEQIDEKLQNGQPAHDEGQFQIFLKQFWNIVSAVLEKDIVERAEKKQHDVLIDEPVCRIVYPCDQNRFVKQ